MPILDSSIVMNEASKNATGGATGEKSQSNWLEMVRDQVASLRFGTVAITVHDGRVVQVEKNEKLRLGPDKV